ASVKMKNGTLNVEVLNNKPENKYVESAYLNDQPLTDLSFTHEQIRNGGKLKIVMTDNKKK
ncbi:MAG: glycoside hydrolase domain-containing protein, partial [Bacteroidales bacterium]